jgi:hypothetical protein
VVGAVVLLCVLAACGSSGSSASAPSNPLATELSYMPATSPLVFTLATDPSSTPVKNANALLARFQVAGLLASALKEKLQQQGINYDTQIRPLLGNPVVFATLAPTLSDNTSSLVVAWVTKDASALNALVTKQGSGTQKTGSHDGATLYKTKSAVLAVKGPTLVIADTQSDVDAALDRQAAGGGLTQGTYNQDIAGLPQGALLQVFGNLTASLSGPREASARRVPWVAALNGYAVALTATPSGISLNYRLDTSGQQLTAAELPIATGTSSPGLIANAAGSFGLRDPAQLVAFIESVAQTSNKAGFASFLRGLATLRSKTGVDLNSLIGELSGDLVTAGGGNTELVRVGVSQPAAVSAMFAKLASHIHSMSPQLSATALPGGFYAVRHGKDTFNVGVVGNQIVGGNVPPAALRGFAATPTSPLSGAQGAMAFSASLAQALKLTGDLVHSPQAELVLSQLGDVTGWLSVSPSALTGSATLGIK